jgi:hypothetical protein
MTSKAHKQNVCGLFLFSCDRLMPNDVPKKMLDSVLNPGLKISTEL